MPKAIKKKPETPKKPGEGDIAGAWDAMKARAETLRRYTNLIIAAAVILVVGITAYGVTLNSAKKARLLEYEGYRLYHGKFDQPNLEITRLQDALKKFEDADALKASPFSLYYISLCQSALGEGQKAAEGLEKLIREFPSDTLFAPLARYRLAGTALKDGNEQAAISHLEGLIADRKSALRDLSLAEESRILEDSGKKDEAMAKLRQLVDEHPKSPIAEFAKPQLQKQAAVANAPVAVGAQGSEVPKDK